MNNWFENLSSEDMPPTWMWPYDDELSTWFEGVEERRKDRYGGGSDGPMVRNEWGEEDDE